MTALRLSIIGAGGVVENRHLPGLAEMEDVQLVSIWSRRPERARQVGQAHGIGRVEQTWQAIAAAGDVDAVIVAAPPVLHARASVAALEAGKHVLCQGRMARHLQEALQMVEAARKSGRVAALYPPRPGLKGDRVVRHLLAEGYVGSVREVRVTGMGLSGAAAGYRWISDPEVVGVNAMTLGLWAEVLNRWTGPARRVWARSQTHQDGRQTPDGHSVPAAVPDSLVVAAELDCGAMATYHFFDAAAFGPGNFIEIYGDKGALVYELFKDRLRGAGPGDEELAEIEIPADSVREQRTDVEFVEAIRGGPPVSPDFLEGLEYMKFCEAVALSCHTGRMVEMTTLQPSMAAWDQPLGER